jgi:hypothetical protein
MLEISLEFWQVSSECPEIPCFCDEILKKGNLFLTLREEKGGTFFFSAGTVFRLTETVP